MATIERIRVQPGDTVRIMLAYSEVCMHMQVAGQVRNVALIPCACVGAMAQLLNDDGTVFSYPITLGEAGIRRDAEGLWADPVSEPTAFAVTRYTPRNPRGWDVVEV